MADRASASSSDAADAKSNTRAVAGPADEEPRVRELEREIETNKAKAARLAAEECELQRELTRERGIARVNARFHGKDEDDILREMVRDLLPDVEDPEGLSKTKCRDHLKGTYINIFDYVEERFDEACESIQELRKRCRKIGTFPLERAKNEHLRGLLRKLFF